MQVGTRSDLARNLVFLDGLPRCGKGILSAILPSLATAEHFHINYLIDQIIPLLYLGKISVDGARILLQTTLNEICYNNFLGRNSNFRHDDLTGVHQYREPKVYFARLSKPDGEAVAEEARQSTNFIPFQTHDLLTNLDLLDAMELDYRMIAFFRDPVDTAYSWQTWGLGDRYGEDPRIFEIKIMHKEQYVPWLACQQEDKWLSMNTYERSCHFTVDLIKKAIGQYKTASNPEKILLLTFEEFVTETESEMKRICHFLDTSESSSTPKALATARCPRTILMASRDDKLKEFKANVDAEIYEDLVELSNAYLVQVHGLKPDFRDGRS